MPQRIGLSHVSDSLPSTLVVRHLLRQHRAARTTRLSKGSRDRMEETRCRQEIHSLDDLPDSIRLRADPRVRRCRRRASVRGLALTRNQTDPLPEIAGPLTLEAKPCDTTH